MTVKAASISTALAWVRDDLDKRIEKSRLQIEHAANNPAAGVEALGTTEQDLQHLKDTFQTLMVNGAVFLLEDMLTVCDRIRHYKVDSRESAFAAMMDAIVVLPSYVDRLQAGHADLPMLLLPAINRMRSTHGAPLLQEAAVFTPDLDVELPELGEQEQETTRDEPFGELASRLQQQFENAMLNWLQEQDRLEHLSPLQGVCETLLHRVQRPEQRRLWWIASELLESLLGGRVANDATMHRLLARIHLSVKTLAEKGESDDTQDQAESLARSLLLKVAQTGKRDPGLEQVRKTFKLDEQALEPDEMLRAQSTVSGRNRDMYESLGSAVREELQVIKDVLDLELRTGRINEEHRAECMDSLGRLEDTLRMLGLAETADRTAALVPEFEASAEAGESREAALATLAEQLLLVESALNEQIETLGAPLSGDDGAHFIELPRHEFRRVVNHLLDETVAALREFQEAIKARFGGNAREDFCAPLEQVASALVMIGESAVSELTLRLARTAGYLFRNVYSERAVPAKDLEAFTDAVAALELFLAACRDRQGERARFSGIIEDRLDRLPESDEARAELDSHLPDVREPAPDAPAGPIEVVQKQEEPGPEADELPPDVDPEMLQVFLEEYDEVSESFHHHIPEWLEHLEDRRLLTEIRRGFHTLKGSGRMVGAHELGDFCWRIEELLNQLLEGKLDRFADAAVMVRLAQASLPALKQRLMQQPVGLSRAAIRAIGRHAEYLATGQSPEWIRLHQALPAFLAGMLPDAPSPDDIPDQPARGDAIRAAQIEDLERNLKPLQQLLEAVSNRRATATTREHLRAAHTLAGALATAPSGREADVARSLEQLLEAQAVSGNAYSVDTVFVLATAIGHLQAHLDLLAGRSDTGSDQDEDTLITQMQDLAARISSGEEDGGPLELVEEHSLQDEADEASAEESEPPAIVSGITADASPPTDEGEHDEPELELDDEIIQIFIEEASEVLTRADSLLNEWRDSLNNLDIVKNLQREIHTFKGGARMAGLESLGELSHVMESVLEDLASGSLAPSASAVGALETGCDRLLGWVGEVSRGHVPDAGNAIRLFEQQAQDLADVPFQAPAGAVEDDQPRETQALPEAPDAANRSDERSGGYIRVEADLLDSMVNAAGEVSILRSRLQQQIEGLRGSLGEFDETISRLREQFRKLEIETETQIRSRYRDSAEPDTEEFDPLELDRFSAMQQLSRGLSESVSDLLNLQEMLDEAARQSDNLLSQQSRYTNELQEGLLQTRMVPFGSVAPRLRRLVRTAARDAGKKARLQLSMIGTSDQLDRNVLERITAPLEHMLRNAVAHGIESPDERKKAGKPAEGDITITVESETTEFTIRISDDGGGINLDAIRAKAAERGLIDKDADPPRQKLLEFILDSGFSTSSEVTGLAGRGVGMDVVNSEIKQIGGSLEIDSEDGKGTWFTIRIPFTLAVMQAIGVMAGDNRYLVPLTSVAGVARVLPEDYRQMLEAEEPDFEFAGDSYPVL
ncbi:MAG: Hpt domain-containing protein, partial [Xanthomonadales bacterium]|nr:Hpt domain-containing protein [Xanthomonadales bacterium]